MGFGHEDLNKVKNKRRKQGKDDKNTLKSARYTNKIEQNKRIKVELDILLDDFKKENFMEMSTSNPFDENKITAKKPKFYNNSDKKKFSKGNSVPITPFDQFDSEEDIKEKDYNFKNQEMSDFNYNLNFDKQKLKNPSPMVVEKSEKTVKEDKRVLNREEKNKADDILKQKWVKVDEYNPFDDELDESVCTVKEEKN